MTGRIASIALHNYLPPEFLANQRRPALVLRL